MRLLLIGLLALAAPAAAAPVCDAVWHDAARDRDVPVRIRLPQGDGRVPLVLFSHGLGGDIGSGAIWTSAWVDHGLAVVHIQHHGSDIAVYRGATGPDDRRARVHAAATAEQLLARVADAGFVLDELGRRKTEGACDLTRIDTSRAGFAGHSMGAWTAQALAGQRWFGAARLVDPRFRAAIAFSPSAFAISPPASAETELAAAFGGITMPFFSITGTADGAPPTSDTVQQAAAEAQRVGPYIGMSPGDKFLLVFKDGDHLVFSGNRLRRAPIAADPHIQAVTVAASTAFWGATLLGDTGDTAFLASPTGLRAQLAPGDRFASK